MRIPSQFNDSSLYRPRRGEKNAKKTAHVPGGADTRRRLIRLGVALMLVIVVMREAGRPGIYQTFFGTDRPGWVSFDQNSAGNSPAVQSAGTSQTVASGAQAMILLQPEDPQVLDLQEAAAETAERRSMLRRSLAHWVDSMELSLQRAWVQSLVTLKTSSETADEVQWAGLSAEQLVDSSERLANQSEWFAEDDLASIEETLKRIETVAVTGAIPPEFWREIDSWAIAMLDELDRAALTRVVDGTFWTGADSDAFYLQLARADEVTDTGAVTTGTVPLLQQPDIYRGQRVGIVGTLQLAEQIQAKKNRVGIVSYWKLWIIPADGGIRPTVLIAPRLPEAIAGSVNKQGKWDSNANPANPEGQIAAVGRFIKRLPYRSSIGADLAPVVIGRLVATKGVAGPSASSPTAAALSQRDRNATATGTWKMLGLFAAVVGGIAIAIGLMYRTSLDAKRSRQMRRQTIEGNSLNLEQLNRDQLSSASQPPDGE